MSERSLCHWTNSQHNSLPRTVSINICRRIGTLDINWETQIFIWKGKIIKPYLSIQGRKSSFFLKGYMALSRVFMFLKNCIRCKFEEGYSLPENTNTCKWYCDKINISPLKKIYLGCLLCANQSWRWQLNLLDLVFSGLSLTSFLKIHQIIIWPFEHPRIMGMFSIIPMFQQFDFKE